MDCRCYALPGTSGSDFRLRYPSRLGPEWSRRYRLPCTAADGFTETITQRSTGRTLDTGSSLTHIVAVGVTGRLVTCISSHTESRPLSSRMPAEDASPVGCHLSAYLIGIGTVPNRNRCVGRAA